MKRVILRLVVLVTASVLFVLVFYAQYGTQNAVVFHPFERYFVKDALYGSRATDLQYNSYYIAGQADNAIYLGNSVASSRLMIVRGDTLKLRALNGLNGIAHANKVRIDSPFLYAEDLVSYKIYKGNLTDLNVKIIEFDSVFFSEAIPIDSNSIIRRTFGNKGREYVLTKESIKPHSQKEAANLLEKQVDGLFCTDGMLHFDKKDDRLTYVYFYRNEFFCTNTNLNLLFRGNTIDTNSVAKIKVAVIESENSITLSAPPVIVNRRSWTSDNWLFVNSALMAKNEDRDKFLSASVIDVYDLNDMGKYHISFYIRNYKGHKMKMFAVFGSQVYSIHDRYLVTHTLNTSHF